MPYDVGAVRRAFPALSDGTARFDGPGGSLVPEPVGAAVADALVSGLANRGTVTGAERRADHIVRTARSALADLVGAPAPEGVVFGRSMTALTYDIARTVAGTWGSHDEIVVTRLDHDANIRPWVQAAERAGATVRWADFDAETGELATEDVARLLSRRTRLVAVTAASNLLGTRPDVAGIADAAHEVNALVYVDGVHLTPHAPVDMRVLEADFYACSPYKFFGPHLGAVVASPELLDRLRPDKLLPSSDAVPERFELGTLPYELLAGVTAAVDFLADLAAPTDAGRRERLTASMTALEAHEAALFDRLVGGLEAIPLVTRHGRPARRTPTVLFSIAGVSPAQAYAGLAARGVNAPASNFYAIEASRALGLGDAGAVRAGVSPYTDESDVDRLLTGVAELAGAAVDAEAPR